MKTSFKKRVMVILTMLAWALGASGVIPARAATITVSNLDDSGAGSLRQAILDAESAPGADTIDFSVSGTITLESTLPGITDADGLTIDGTGQSVTISGDDLYQTLIVDESASLTLDHLTIANGKADTNGGGIMNAGTLTVTNSTFSGNSAADYGGGIFNADTATATVADCTFSFNTSHHGGGIHNYGSLTVTGSTLVGNSVTGNGGGIANEDTMQVTNSTVAGNHADNLGGGVFGYTGTMTVKNSTFSGNGAGNNGSGISNFDASTLDLINTILANSTGGADCHNTGTVVTNVHNNNNLIEVNTGCVTPVSSADPDLGLLQDNGGLTHTMAIGQTSPAFNNGYNDACPSTDQRGEPRPQGGTCDIGAFESEAQAGPEFVVNTSADTNDGACDLLGQGIGNQDCTLREAINAANAITGANSITFSVSGTITLSSTLPGITDADGLTIDGAGQSVTVSGNDLYRVLLVDAGASLTLDYLTIADGWALYGSGIRNEGTLTITDSTVSGNSAPLEGGYGGGIFNNGTLTITGSTFSDNYAYWAGGGIHNDGTLSITESTFSGNAASYGAAIVNDGTLEITNSTFSGNSAAVSGGGVYNSASSTLTITNSTFSGNNAVNSGGSIVNLASTGELFNTIVANSLLGGNCFGTIGNGGNNIDDGTTCDWGTADGSMSSTDPLLAELADNGGPTQTFALLPSSPAIDGVTFNAPNGAPATDQRGVARPVGGGYDIGAFEYEPPTQAGPDFIVNVSADTNDGACDLLGQGIGNQDCTLREAIEAANTLDGANTITFSVSGTIILSSTLPGITDADGLTIDGAGQSVTVSGNDLYRVLLVDAGASLTLDHLTIADGTWFNGSGVRNEGTLTITNSTFSGNNSPLEGGYGGGIFNNGTLTITGSTFSDNYAYWAGGGIHNDGTLSITESTFSSNAASYGAAIVNDGTLTITTGSTFSGNGATAHGGGIYNTGTLDITASTFSGNGATAHGGGIYNVGTLDITNGTFSDNIAAYGGAIKNDSELTNTITDSTFTGNAATAHGGGIYNTGMLDITNGTFSDNTAAYGGAIKNDSELTISNSTFSGNYTTDYGGGIYNSETLIISNSTFNNNSTIAHGGAVDNWDSGTVMVENSTFSGNSAAYGGGINNSGTLTVTSSNFSGNYATAHGGGIGNAETLDITNSTFSGNVAAFGGAIKNDSELTITNGTLSGNGAVEMGGGIFSSSVSNTTLRNTIVVNSPLGRNCYGPISNGGNNIDDGTTCGWGSVDGSKSSTDPLLGVPAYYGGPTQTIPLLPGSPAIDGVTFDAPNEAPLTDQRGVTRPQGDGYDIGAFESGVFTQLGPSFVVNSDADSDDEYCDFLGQGIGNQDCTLREAIDAANGYAGENKITFSVSGTITLGSTLPKITDSDGLTIDGAGQTVTISGDGLYQVLYVNAGGSLTLDHLTIANGHSAQTGGGIYNAGTLDIMNSTFSGNLAALGGAIMNESELTNTITNSTFSGNSATSFGGGIFNSGTVDITNTTISGNSADIYGGGIFGPGTASLRNTIVASSPSGGNCGDTIINGGNNIDDGTTCGWDSNYGSMSSTDPLLAELADNGGPTRTFALLLGSPAIDGIPLNLPNGAPSTDQRGIWRQQWEGYDIGAFELEGPSSITVLLHAIPDDGRDFPFTGTGPDGYDFEGGFSLDDDADETLPNRIRFSNLSPGSYTLQESDLDGWSLRDLVCVEPYSGSTVDQENGTAMIELDPHEPVTCTYINQRDNSLFAIVDVYVTNSENWLPVPPDETYTGVAWNYPPSDTICTIPYLSLFEPSTYVTPKNINWGIGGDFVYLWVKYDWVEATADTPVLVDIAVHEWDTNDAWAVDCPEGWEPAHGDAGGALTTQADDDCWRNGLCVRYAPMNETDTFITNLNLSFTEDSEAVVPALCPANEGYWPMRQDDLDIHMGCGDGYWMFLTYNQARRWPAMPTSLPAPSDSEKASILQQYSPRVWLADYEPDHPEGEIYFPSSVEWSFEYLNRIFQYSVYDWRLFTKENLESSDVLPYFHGCYGGYTSSPCSLEDVPVYAFWDEVEIDVSGEKVTAYDLIYFFYYPYNRGKEVLGTVYGNHVGDWEHVSVRLTPQWEEGVGWSLKPAQIYLSAHDFGRNYGWDQISTEVGYELFLPVVLYQASTSPSAGAVQSEPLAPDSFSSPLATHPVVYAAWGAHGLWRDPGEHVYKHLPAPLSGDLSDWTGAGTAWDTWRRILAFDYDAQSGLAGSTWPVWMRKDYDDPGIGGIDPASGPIYRWGNDERDCDMGECRLACGPTGPVDKSVWDSEILQ